MRKRFECVLLDFDDTLYPFEVCERATLEMIYAELESQVGTSVLGDYDRFEALYCHTRRAVDNYLSFRVADDAADSLPSYTQAGSHSRTVIFKWLLTDLLGTEDPARILRLSVELGKHYDSWFRHHMVESYPPEITLLLDDLVQAGGRIGLLTNYTLQTQLRKLQALQIADRFDIVLASEETGWDKPHPRIFERALEDLNCKPRDAVMIGDSYSDIEGALNAGMNAIRFQQSRKRLVCAGGTAEGVSQWETITAKYAHANDIDDLRKLLFQPV